jgi:hypothetical protein
MIISSGGGGAQPKTYTSGIGVSLGKAVAKAVKPRSSAVRRTSTTSRRSSGSSGSNYGNSGSSGGSSGGGGGGGYSAGGSAASAAPSLAQYLSGDSSYQSTLSGSKRSLSDFLSELSRRRGEANTQFNQTTASMERDRVQQLDDLKNEFASRGLIQSGLYGQEQGNFQTKFQEQQTALQQQQAALLADLLSQQKNYSRENSLTLEQAKQEALARRAAKYNIGG